MVGTTVSHYKITEKLGEGGMGVVYKAHDLKLDRAVALKFLPAQSTQDLRARHHFIQEATGASSLQHNNICTVHDIDETTDGRMFIVMDCYEGESLKETIARDPIRPEDAVNITRQIAQGLQKAHEKGIIHRDIKPGNIIVTRDGVAKILDFGLAKLSDQTRITCGDAAVGTPAYMSPEQVRGENVDHRTDLWSLGALFYEMLTGRPPFAAEHPEALVYCILNTDPLPPSTLRPEIPKDIEAIVLKLLNKDPAERYESAQMLCSDLQCLDTGTGSHSRVRTFTRQLWSSIYTYIAAVIILSLVAWIIWPRSTLPLTKKPWRIAIFPPLRITQKAEAADWPLEIQMMMVDQLNGTEDLRIIDPFSLAQVTENTTGGAVHALASARQFGASYVINGTVESPDSSFVLRSTFIDESDGSVKLSCSSPFRSAIELPQAVQNASQQILNYFQIQALSHDERNKKDLQPWLSHRTKQLDAIRAFLEGLECIRHWQHGATKYFRKAIDLDSTFITPRTWLISSLVNDLKFDEANFHQAFLLRHQSEAGPFEQALIRWTGSLINGNLDGQARALEEALDYSPGNDVLMYLLADVKISQEDFAASANVIRPAIESGWSFQPASLLLGYSLFHTGEFSQCREVLERSLNLEPVLPETYAYLAALALHDGDSTQGERYASEYIKISRNEGASRDSTFAALASQYQFIGLHEPASAYFTRATQLNPYKAEYHLGLTESLLDLGDLTLACEAVGKARALDSTSFQVHRLLGRIAEQKHDTTEALMHYAVCLAADSVTLRSREIRSRISDLLRK